MAEVPEMKSMLTSHWIMLENIVSYMPCLSMKLLYRRFVCTSVWLCLYLCTLRWICVYVFAVCLYAHVCVHACVQYYSECSMIKNSSWLFSIFRRANLRAYKHSKLSLYLILHINMRPDFGKSTKLSHLVLWEIPILKIEAFVVSLC